MEAKRYALLDTIRGMVLISMIVYHGIWNLVYIYGKDWDWYRSYGAYIWQQSICWTFILLSGFCFSLGKRHLKSGLLVFGSGALVTLVTLIAMPTNRVVFGVLTCIGSCILILTFTRRIWEKIPCEAGMLFCFFLFMLTKSINNGYLGIMDIGIIELPRGWYRNYITTYLGLPFVRFYSTDYFSLIPWIFLFMTGFYLYGIVYKRRLLQKSFMKKEIRIFSFLGRHSLLVYLLHQPIIYGLQELIGK